jgi:phage terminase small subunit
MPALENHRRELFAQLLVQGFTVVDAHERAGYRRNEGNASMLARHPEVQARLKEIKSAVAVRTVITTETLINEAEEVRKAAYDSGQFGAANTAIKGKAILSGKWIERAEVGAPGEYENMTDDELERQLMARFAKLGFARVDALVDFSPSETDAEDAIPDQAK